MMIMHHTTSSQEKKILRWSMAVLFLTFMIVYFVLYSVKGPLPAWILTTQTWWDIVIKEKSISDTLQENPFLVDEMATWTVGFTSWTKQTWIASPSVTGTSLLSKTGTGRTLLSWTSLYYGELDFIEKLGISYEYALKDLSGSYFVYMGKELKYDFSNIARKLGGNLYVMNTQQEITRNKLFGDKIIFINIPEYKNTYVIMLAYVREDIRLIKMDYTLYHTSKLYLQRLFTD